MYCPEGGTLKVATVLGRLFILINVKGPNISYAKNKSHKGSPIIKLIHQISKNLSKSINTK